MNLTFTKTVSTEKAGALSHACRKLGFDCYTEPANSAWSRARVVFRNMRPGTKRAEHACRLIESLLGLGVGDKS